MAIAAIRELRQAHPSPIESSFDIAASWSPGLDRDSRPRKVRVDPRVATFAKPKNTALHDTKLGPEKSRGKLFADVD